MKSAAAITFDYRASRVLAAAFAAVAFAAVASVLASGLGTWPKGASLLAVVAVVARAASAWRRGAGTRLAWLEGGDWVLRDATGAERAARLLGARVVGPMVAIVVRPLPGGAALPLVLLPDNSDAETRRRLRVRLAALSSPSD